MTAHSIQKMCILVWLAEANVEEKYVYVIDPVLSDACVLVSLYVWHVIVNNLHENSAGPVQRVKAVSYFTLFMAVAATVFAI